MPLSEPWKTYTAPRPSGPSYGAPTAISIIQEIHTCSSCMDVCMYLKTDYVPKYHLQLGDVMQELCMLAESG
jgi:hypothetical protein